MQVPFYPKTSLYTGILFPFQEQGKDITQLADKLSSLSLNSSTSARLAPEIISKLEELVKIRKVMKFNSLSDKSVESSSYPFSHEEMALLQKLPKGRDYSWGIELQCRMVLQ